MATNPSAVAPVCRVPGTAAPRSCCASLPVFSITACCAFVCAGCCAAVCAGCCAAVCAGCCAAVCAGCCAAVCAGCCDAEARCCSCTACIGESRDSSGPLSAAVPAFARTTRSLSTADTRSCTEAATRSVTAAEETGIDLLPASAAADPSAAVCSSTRPAGAAPSGALCSSFASTGSACAPGSRISFWLPPLSGAGRPISPAVTMVMPAATICVASAGCTFCCTSANGTLCCASAAKLLRSVSFPSASLSAPFELPGAGMGELLFAAVAANTSLPCCVASAADVICCALAAKLLRFK